MIHAAPPARTVESGGTRILSGRDVAAALDWPSCLQAVEQAFADYAAGRAALPAIAPIGARHGTFHVKAAALAAGRPYVAVKLNANFPGNPERLALPTIQGAVLLCDAEDGRLLAILDSAELTARRTAAATAVAASYLARADSRCITLIGCGAQAPYQLRALSRVLNPRLIFVFDTEPAASHRLAAAMAAELRIDVVAVADFAAVTRRSDVIVTCTPARRCFLEPQHLGPGTFVAAVGADAPDKQELHPALLSASRVVVDVLEQCAGMGDLHHALEAGSMTRADVHADLGSVVSGRSSGRRSPTDTFVFDSTGVAIQDVAAAAAAYRRACDQAIGRVIELGGSAPIEEAAP